MNIPVELPYQTCRDLLASREAGRVAVCTPDGPRIIPVNYSIVDEMLVFRTTPYSVLGTYARSSQLAFEVDDFRPEDRSGWSVVAVGRGRMIDDPEELRRIRAHRDPDPWVGGKRWLYIGLEWRDLTGRRVQPRAVGERVPGAR